MTTSPTENYTVVPDDDYVRVRRAFLAADGDFLRNLERMFAVQGAMVAARAAGAVRSIPTSGRHSTGVRSRIANSIRSEAWRHAYGGWTTTAGVHIAADTSDTTATVLARGWDSPGGWDHPVFGRGGSRVHQAGHPWFMSTLKVHAPLIAAGIEAVVRYTAARIERAGI